MTRDLRRVTCVASSNLYAQRRTTSVRSQQASNALLQLTAINIHEASFQKKILHFSCLCWLGVAAMLTSSEIQILISRFFEQTNYTEPDSHGDKYLPEAEQILSLRPFYCLSHFDDDKGVLDAETSLFMAMHNTSSAVNYRIPANSKIYAFMGCLFGEQ